MRVKLTLLLTLLTGGALAQPRVVVILVHEGHTHEDLGGAVRHQRAWMLWSDTATPARALTLATGEPQNASPSEVALAFAESPNEHGTAGEAFQRRTGRTPPARAVVALGAGALSRKGLLTKTFASRMNALGKRGVYMRLQDSPSPTPYALLAVSEKGYFTPQTFPDAELLRVALLQKQVDWALIEVSRWRYSDWELLIGEGIETWVVCTRAPPEAQGSRLTAVVRYATRERNGLLTSPSTRWAGLIRDVDFAPSLEYALVRRWNPARSAGAPAFEVSRSDWHRFWNGLLVRTASRRISEQIGYGWQSDALGRILGLEWVQRELTPVVESAIGGLGLGWLVMGLALWRAGWLHGRLRRLFVTGLGLWALAPAVFLSLAYCPFVMWEANYGVDTAAIGGWLTGVWLALAMCAWGLARALELPLMGAVGFLTLALVMTDLLIAGSYGVNRSLMATGLVGGERLYGVDGFWLGVVLTAGVLAPSAYLESRQKGRFGNRGLLGLGALYGCLMLMSGLPLLGANFAAWSVLGAGFGLVALYQARVLPETPSPRMLILVVLALAALGWWLAWAMEVYDASQAWQKRAVGVPMLGWSLTSVGYGLALAGTAALGAWLFRGQVARFWARSTAMRWGVLACLAGGLSALFLLPDGWRTLMVACLGVCLWSAESLLGVREWGYPAEANGKAH